MEKSDFEVMSVMSSNNMDIACAFELLNFTRQEKKGGGLVQVGVASPQFDYLINQAASGKTTHLAVFYIVNKEQYHAIKSNGVPTPRQSLQEIIKKCRQEIITNVAADLPENDPENNTNLMNEIIDIAEKGIGGLSV